MPVGPDVNVRLRIAGFFFKLWSYEQTQLDPQAPPARQLAPTLVGREPRLIKPQGSIVSLARTVAAVLAGAAVLGTLLAVWRFGRGDRKFHQRVFAKRYQPTDGRSLNDLGLDANDVPDFRRLEP